MDQNQTNQDPLLESGAENELKKLRKIENALISVSDKSDLKKILLNLAIFKINFIILYYNKNVPESGQKDIKICKIVKKKCYIQSGTSEPTPNKGKMIKYNKITITPIAIRFNQKPHLAITGIEIFPLDNTMALGPVPEGSINAQEAAIEAGIINKNG